ncbi:HIT domain-containing protein [Azospirillum halopraeferens]|uniref:HIT domain-containing protein n=1 Tax=Azospirillum halopraeferens TaxID=34010 RepID=UPI00040192D1|nr:HIT family protein [Azospirillum halopraeferens]
MFRLNERLAGDTVPLGVSPLCRVLLMDNRHWPWLILVPERPDVRELHHLDAPDRVRLIEEISFVSKVLEDVSRPDKLNVGALGNVVPQLHVHVIARRRDDPAWPGPVWGSGHADRYPAGERDAWTQRLREALRPLWRE